MVGCDGANSITRKSIKSKFSNLGFTQKWAVIDLILNKKKNLPDRTIQYSNPKDQQHIAEMLEKGEDGNLH